MADAHKTLMAWLSRHPELANPVEGPVAVHSFLRGFILARTPGVVRVMGPEREAVLKVPDGRGNCAVCGRMGNLKGLGLACENCEEVKP